MFWSLVTRVFLVITIGGGSAFACDEKKQVVTEQGIFHVPGNARVTGGTSVVTSVRMENGCEITGTGQRVSILSSKKVFDGGTEVTLFEVKGVRGCQTGWLNSRFLSPVPDGQE